MHEMHELLILSYNFSEPIDVYVGDQLVTGIVDCLGDDAVLINGMWYPLRSIKEVTEPCMIQ